MRGFKAPRGEALRTVNEGLLETVLSLLWNNVESAYQLYTDRAADSTGVAEKVSYIVLRERRAESKRRQMFGNSDDEICGGV